MRQWAGRRLAGLVVVIGALGVGAWPADAGAQEPPERRQDAITYVALGDSFTSGPLVPNQVGTPIDCARSDRNYPQLVAAALDVAELRDVSCGSATIDDLYEPQDGLPLGGVNPPQFDALDAGVDVVTVGMGGNDIGYVGLALDCVRLLAPPLQPPCTPRLEADGTDAVTAKIAAVGPELGEALRDIRRLAPGAEVFVVGYPAGLPDDGVACWPYVPILPRDMPYLVAKFKEMNAMLAERAAANGATYVDIYTPSIGHDACQLPGTAWVNGMLIVPPSFPAHPNALSYRNSAPVIAQAISASGKSGGPAVLSAPATERLEPGSDATDEPGPEVPGAAPRATRGATEQAAATTVGSASEQQARRRGPLARTGAAGLAGAAIGATLLGAALTGRAVARRAGR